MKNASGKFLLTLFAASTWSCWAQRVYELSASKTPMEIVDGKLDMGGTSPTGGTITVNSFYMSVDGRPVIPVIGEFHYSRYPHEQWEEEILKMKAGGVGVVSTYVFWSFHEEFEDKWDWSGNRDLRAFIQLCEKHGMPVIVRIGPFCHGEVRNGAIPDWVLAKNLELRSNDGQYLRLAKKLYHQIALQLKGLYYKDGGPVIGCQLENEMQHSASPWGIWYPGEPTDWTAGSTRSFASNIPFGKEAGNEHMRTLLKIAQDEGILTPLYTATAWGNAAVVGNKAIPVTSAYAYPTWESVPRKSVFMMFKDLRKTPDYSPVRYNPNDFPSFSVEMGAGQQMVYQSRPVIPGSSAEAMMIRTLGSGSNALGYYMYHGGSTPRRSGDNAFFSDEAKGCPKISYDFVAPIGEFGLEHDSYRPLRLIHSFLADWGAELAPMETVLPKGWENMSPDNRDDLRYAARMKDGKGFVFMVNFQDHDTTRVDQTGLQLKLNLGNETLLIPSKGTFTLPRDRSLILPFNLSLDGALLKYATVQPLMKIDDEGCSHYFFFALDGMQAEFAFDKATVKGKSLYRVQSGLNSTFTVKSAIGKAFKITTLTRQQALDACKVNGKLLITNSTVLPAADGARLLSLGDNNFRYVVYPSSKGLKEQKASVAAVCPKFSVNRSGSRRMSVHFNDSGSTPQVREYFLQIKYVGDVAMAFMDGQLCQDEFWHGEPWTIGLKRYKEKMRNQDMTFYFRPLKEKLPFVKRDLYPFTRSIDFSKGSVLSIDEVNIIPEYIKNITF